MQSRGYIDTFVGAISPALADILSVAVASCSFFRAEYTLNHLLGTMHMPHIALLDGIVMGGGAGVSIHGQFRIATER